jgi:Zn-dependent protease
MTPLFLLFILGVITYFIVQRQVAGMTRTPVWLLWLVVMTPALVWMMWAIVHGNDKPMPAALVWLPFVICLVAYWGLIYAGRIPPNSSSNSPNGNTDTPKSTDPEAANRPDHPSERTGPSSKADPALPMAALLDHHSEAKPPRPLTTDEEKTLQTCFPWSTYYLQNIDYRPQAVICRGQLRSQPDVAYKTIRDNVEAAFGDRFFVVFQEGTTGKPFFALVPNTLNKADSPPILRPRMALGLLLLTLFTTTLGWSQLQGTAAPSGAALLWGLPYAVTLIGILGIHELGHYLVARRYQIQVTLPYFIPVIPVPLFPFGTLGAFIQMRSPVPHRRALFDIGLAGPLCGLLLLFPMLLIGLSQSAVVPAPAASNTISFTTTVDPSLSLLLSLLSKLALGQALTPDSAIQLHPIALASGLGLVMTAYNLMPVGPLDGGHIVHAMVGQRTGAMIGQVFRLLLLALSMVQSHLLVWAVLLLLLPANDEPALNDVTELDNRRDLLGLMAMGLLLLIILPTPVFLARWLNI